MINLTLLGTGGGMPMPNRFLSSIVMNFKGRKILLDCGEGTQVAMRIVNTGFKSIDVICISHVHGDHTNGLPGLLSTIGNSGRIEPLYIIGPKGLKSVLEGFLINLPYLPYEINILEDLKEGEFIINKEGIRVKKEGDNINCDLIIKTLELNHSSNCLGYSFNLKRGRKFDVNKAIENKVPKELWSKLQKNIEEELDGVNYSSNMVLGEERRGLKVSYITDTRPTNEIPIFIGESDLFICEGTYALDSDIEKAIKNKHMTFREAATLALDGKVKELILTHFSPSIGEPKEFEENAKVVFKDSVIGEDGLEKILNFQE